MNKWETFEAEVLDALGVGGRFTAHTVAADRGITVVEATGLIQGYLRAVRAKRSRTRYGLTREGQTTAAVWTVAKRTADARQIVRRFGQDVERKITRAVDRDLLRQLDLNPRARQAVEEQLAPMIGGLVTIIEGMLATVGDN